MSSNPPRITTADFDTGRTQESPDDPPPPYFGSEYGTINDEQEGTNASVADDGRVNIRINQKTRGLSSLLVPALRSQLDLTRSHGLQEPYIPRTFVPHPGVKAPPPLNVVIHVVGSRGDVQPFVALGKVLKAEYGHRVRLATHPTFRDFVTENGLEFFDIGGDPSELMAFMVKNPGLTPAFDTIRRGDIGRRRKEISKMVQGCWRSCIESGDGSGPEASDSTVEEWMRTDGTADTNTQASPFVADAIIANPPSFAHIHCAEKLGIPLHMMFTMPWSPTQAFPHPLANIQSSNAEASLTNFMSYALVDMMTWQGLGDIINRFRQTSLNLEPVSLTWAPGMLARLKVPWTYCWSPTLIPKPRDWSSHISISGFYFLSLASNYRPDPSLAAFLDAGPPPVYIGFGSIVVDDPNAMTKLIFDAVRKSGQRALVSKGWGGFGADQMGIPEGVFMLGNVPHDWLFQKVSCVVHHGGAGTTAAGIACGKPTIIVPFFGDQPFWGAMVARAGAGPKPVPYKDLSADVLAGLITEALKPSFVERAKKMAESISHEKGTQTGAQDFHHALDIDKLRCALAPTRAAVWRIKRTEVRLSAFAATVLGNEGLLNFNDMKLYRPREYDVEDEPWDPITGGASMIIGTMSSMAMGVADFPIQTLKMLKIHPDADHRKASEQSTAPESGAPKSSEESRSRTRAISGVLHAHHHGSTDSGFGTEASRSRASSTTTLGEPQGEEAQPVSTSRTSSPDHNSRSTASKYDVSSALFGTTSHASSHSRSRASTRTRSPSPPPSSSSHAPGSSTKEAAKKAEFDIFSALETGHGVFRMASSLSKSPMEFTHALARGFHNAPKLYGDTIRPTPKITSFSSGLAAAGKELGYGFYDGITGLVTQPLEGARKEGAAGFLKGFGKGIGGVVLKPGAGIWGIPGYTSKGIYKELQKAFGPSVENYIIASRTAQGMAEVVASSEQERAEVVRRWKEMKPYIKRKEVPADKVKEKKEHLKAKKQEIKHNLKDKYGMKVGERGEEDSSMGDQGLERVDSGVISGDGEDDVDMQPLRNVGGSGQVHQQHHGDHDADAEVEEAIRRSVQESSHGNNSEDAMIERAIRASMRELDAERRRQGQAPVEDDDAGLHRAIQASMQMARQHEWSDEKGNPPAYERHDGGRAHEHGGYGHDDDDDDELQRALTESKGAHEPSQEQEEAARREEEVVLNYMMKQSLAEDEARRKRDARG